jgi:predicted O-linked N-acetylglucosamine transferase (SPINDLY family)
MQALPSNPTLSSIDCWRKFYQQDLQKAIDFYEIAISANESITENYWYLGLAYLFVDRESDAQVAWFTPFTLADESEIDELTTASIEVLEREANDRVEMSELDRSWLLRQHIWTLAPERLENIFQLICLAAEIGTLTIETLIEWQVEELLESNSREPIDEDLLEQVLSALITIEHELSLKLIRICLGIPKSNQKLVEKTMVALFQTCNQIGSSLFLVHAGEICHELQPNVLGIIQALNFLYSSVGLYPQAIAAAEKLYRLAPGSVEQLVGSYQLQRTHFTAGNYKEAKAQVENHRQLLAKIILESPQDLVRIQYQSLIVSSFFLPYIEDNPRQYKTLQNKLAAIYQQNIQSQIVDSVLEKTSLLKKNGTIRIAYIGMSFKSHSVGWLMRWLIDRHDRQSFEVFLYCLNTTTNDPFNHQWFRDKVNVASYLHSPPGKIAAQIKADEIDILIDVDSLTYDITCLVMAHKPAPVQVSWLGWDASGIPAVDYFIADNYVLPDDAQDYYQEKIWRLPQTYLAVDGFEVGIPTLRREDLDIPDDAIVYLSAQSGYKRHPDCIRAQMEIIKAVPNSYFLIKGKSDAKTIQNLFVKLAAEVGIGFDRLRFLERDRDEYTHRANLAIADVVLDTFPYNGATTTLETLWMGIPIVTQVGQQFAARNSYTFMINAGITEGIAWNQQEYIDWGIKLGLDRELRWQVKGKLHAGRTSAPVWNAKQFTLDMEQAYREMWAQYQEQQGSNKTDTYDLN